MVKDVCNLVEIVLAGEWKKGGKAWERYAGLDEADPTTGKKVVSIERAVDLVVAQSDDEDEPIHARYIEEASQADPDQVVGGVSPVDGIKDNEVSDGALMVKDFSGI